jgi:DNA polymerase-3 subunit chi
VTEIAFHFGVADKMGYVGRLLRKAHFSNARLLVVGDAQTLNQVDNALWGLSPTEFVPHCRAAAEPFVLARSSIVLAELSETRPGAFSVLLNLAPEIPVGYQEFARVIEVVGQQEGDRQQARQRWKGYAAEGHSIVRHDVAGRPPA